MEKISSIKLNRLTNAAHMEFVNSTVAAVNRVPALLTMDVAKAAVEQLQKARETEDTNFKLMQKSEFSAEISRQNKLRDVNYSAFKKAVSAFKKFPDDGMVEAANRLWEIIGLYKINKDVRLDSKTALLDNLIQDIDERCSADIAVLNLGIVVDNMRSANDDVRRLVALRTSERASRVLWALRTSRQESDVAIKLVLKSVESMAFLFGDTDFVEFVSVYNKLVARYKRQLLPSTPKAEAVADSEEGEEPEMQDNQTE